MNFKPITELDLPPFNMANITNYFITRIACDGKSAKDFKNINTKAFPLFKDGHVQNIAAHIDVKFIFFQAACLPEMKKKIHTELNFVTQEILYPAVVAVQLEVDQTGVANTSLLCVMHLKSSVG